MKGIIIVKKVPATSLKLAKLIASYTSDMKAENIAVLDMRKVANFCDFFVICSGTSTRQVRAIADHIDEEMKELGSKICFKQGFKDGRWVLMDFGTVVAHIFDKDMRDFYALDYLWQDAKRVSWE